MSIQKVVESEGHGAFYSLISLSLAVLLYPQYQWLLAFISSGFVNQVDSALLILGATGVVTGILYIVPFDRFIDWVIKYKVSHDSYSGRLHFIPTRKANSKLVNFVAGVDYLTSTWRIPSWVSIEDSCEHTISSAMKDPSTQKEIWNLKHRSVVGFVFFTWGLALFGVNSQLDYLSALGMVIGIVILITPWMLPSSTRLPTIIRQVAAIRYAEDTLSNWRPRGKETQREPMMKQLANDTTRVESLISDRQWDRIARFYTWLENLLERHNKAGYQVRERVYEVWARAMIDIIAAQNREGPIEALVARYQSAFDVFRKCGRNKLPTWAEKLTADDLSDLPKFLAYPKAWKLVDAYYPDFHHVIFDVFEGLKDERAKVNWVNALVNPELGLSQGNLTTLFRFACQYTGSDISSHAYDLFVNGIRFLPYEEVTISFIGKLVSLADSTSRDYEVNLSRKVISLLISIAQRTDIKTEVREQIVTHAEKHTTITEWFQKDMGANWKEELLALN
jgi:hypothetical protein